MIRTSLSPILLLLLLLDCRNSFVASTSPRSLHASSPTSLKFTNPIDDAEISPYSSDYLFWVDRILGDLRGGGYADDDDDEYYDEYDSEEEEEEDEPVTRRGKGGRNNGPPNRSRPGPRPGHNPKYPPRRPSRKSSSSSSSSSLSGATNAASAATKLATKSLSMTGSLAWNALVKTPGKLAFHVIRPKHVDLVETFGLWRLDQQVVERSNRRDNEQRTITSVATIEFVGPPMPPREKRGRSRRAPRRPPRSGPPPPPLVVVRHSKGEGKDGKDGDEKEVVYRAPYTFVRKNKYLKGASLSSFQTSFVAPAFLVGENQRLYGYKGTWQRKLADKSVIKLKGKIHQVHKQKFGKKRGEYVYGPAVGTFVMRRRVSMSEELYDDEDESEYEETDDDGFEYDDEEEYDEEEDELTEDEYDE
eukprot:CAMPEP_0116146084 /NCGR_PEP_ID=MMETSP0329-20121206/16972_1 /TAXON_ID=697910 /ORGANISM="Pseudo-nitzschia arenysensis, Strain B593" /LENGTH=416 /DNA_ID=CAMNT_0003641801 /DNA_START=86 /DNA_END=1336 /DNA_ORIENTATION=-